MTYRFDWKLMQIEKPIELDHPVFPVPSKEQAAAIIAKHGVERLAEVYKARNDAIRNEQSNPLEFGFELATWKLADAMLGFISYHAFEREIAKLVPLYRLAGRLKVADDLESWLADVALKAAIEAGPYGIALLLGGNRAGKTEYICKRLVQHAVKFEGMEAWMFHESETMSVTYHQKSVYRYLPNNWQEAGKTRKAYVAYKAATGFQPHGYFIGPNGSQVSFRNYKQDEDTIEGGELGDRLQRPCIGFAADELLPLNWLETLYFRLTSRGGKGIVSFTPKYGYTDTVAHFLDAAKTVRTEIAHELDSPRPLPLVQVVKAVPGQMPKAIVYFHSRYNLYPNRNSYDNIVDAACGFGDVVRAIRLYGYADKQEQNLFPKLSERFHSFVLDGDKS